MANENPHDKLKVVKTNDIGELLTNILDLNDYTKKQIDMLGVLRGASGFKPAEPTLHAQAPELPAVEDFETADTGFRSGRAPFNPTAPIDENNIVDRPPSQSAVVNGVRTPIAIPQPMQRIPGKGVEIPVSPNAIANKMPSEPTPQMIWNTQEQAMYGTPTQKAEATNELTVPKSGSLTFDQRVVLKKIGQVKELADIPIIEYDPKDVGKQRIVGTFKGRQGMSPKMIPFDNTLSDQASQTIASQDVAIGNLTKLKDVFSVGNIGKAGMTLAQQVGNSNIFNAGVVTAHSLGLISDDEADALQEFKAEFDSAKQNIAVARGGKQLTIIELQLILNTLPQAFQNPDVWDSIIDRYSNEFNTYRKTVKGGKSSVVPVKGNTETPIKEKATSGTKSTIKPIKNKDVVKKGSKFVVEE